MIVVDSSVWIAKLRNQDTDGHLKLQSIKNTTDILIGDIVLLEVLRGARNDAHAREIELDLRQFQYGEMLDQFLAVRAASHYRALRGIGITIRKIPDIIIATFCIERGHTLIHDDRDFHPFVEHLGLKVL